MGGKLGGCVGRKNPPCPTVYATENTDGVKRAKGTKRKKTAVEEEEDEENITEIPETPEGWTRKVVIRKSVPGADVYYWAPCGKKLRSRPEVERFLKKTKAKGNQEYTGIRAKMFSFSKPSDLNSVQNREKKSETKKEEQTTAVKKTTQKRSHKAKSGKELEMAKEVEAFGVAEKEEEEEKSSEAMAVAVTKPKSKSKSKSKLKSKTQESSEAMAMAMTVTKAKSKTKTAAPQQDEGPRTYWEHLKIDDELYSRGDCAYVISGGDGAWHQHHLSCQAYTSNLRPDS
jgi:hypothetical protein